MRGFTLIELMVVIIIIGILATLGITHYGPYREQTFDREAQANLRLIIAAQKIYRMEQGLYFPLAGGSVDNLTGTGGINDNLRLLLSESNWDYLTKSGANGAAPACAEATRGTRSFRLDTATDDPVSGNCP